MNTLTNTSTNTPTILTDPTNPSPTAVAYLRESTDKSVEETEGLEIQLDRISQFCAKNNYTLTRTFSDEGISGAKEVSERPELVKLIDHCKDTPVTYVIVDKVDRLSRELFNQLWVEKELLKHGTKILYATNDSLNINDLDTDMDRIIKETTRKMMGVFAELERKMIVKRLSDGMKKKASNGDKPVGRQPFGYEYTKDHKTAINDAQAAVIRDIFSFRGNGMSLNQIAAHLNSDAYHSAHSDAYTGNNKDRVWTNQSVRLVLTNDYYIGKVTHSGEKTQGNHTPIISMDMWLSVAAA